MLDDDRHSGTGRAFDRYDDGRRRNEARRDPGWSGSWPAARPAKESSTPWPPASSAATLVGVSDGFAMSTYVSAPVAARFRAGDDPARRRGGRARRVVRLVPVVAGQRRPGPPHRRVRRRSGRRWSSAPPSRPPLTPAASARARRQLFIVDPDRRSASAPPRCSSSSACRRRRAGTRPRRSRRSRSGWRSAGTDRRTRRSRLRRGTTRARAP